MTEHATQRKIFRRIAAEVSQTEAVSALQHYIYTNLPSTYDNPDMTKSEQLANFLAENKPRILAIPAGVLEQNEASKLLSSSENSDFDLNNLNVTTLAIIVKYLIPTSPGREPEPMNSIWNTRLKLLGSTTDLHYFIRLWRLWSKYQHNQQMNHSVDEIYADFQTMQKGVRALIPDESSKVHRKLVRFQKFWDLVQRENNIEILKCVLTNFDSIAKYLHSDQNSVEISLKSGLKQLIKAAGSS